MFLLIADTDEKKQNSQLKKRPIGSPNPPNSHSHPHHTHSLHNPTLSLTHTPSLPHQLTPSPTHTLISTVFVLIEHTNAPAYLKGLASLAWPYHCHKRHVTMRHALLVARRCGRRGARHLEMRDPSRNEGGTELTELWLSRSKTSGQS